MSILRSPVSWLLLVIAVMVTLPLLHSPRSQPVIAVGTATAPYDLEAAMALAGHQLPADRDSYYFFALAEMPAPAGEVLLLSEKLRAAADEHDFLGIAGPDAERNRRTLFAALLPYHGTALTGLVVIFVGPPEHRESVVNAIAETGAEARYVVFPADDPPI